MKISKEIRIKANGENNSIDVYIFSDNDVYFEQTNRLISSQIQMCQSQAMQLAHAIIENCMEWTPIDKAQHKLDAEKHIPVYIKLGDETQIAIAFNYRFFNLFAQPISERISHYSPIQKPKI